MEQGPITTSRRRSVPAMMFWMLLRVLATSCSTGVPLIGKKRIRCSGGGNTVMALMRSSSVRLVRSVIGRLRRRSPWMRCSGLASCQWMLGVVMLFPDDGGVPRQRSAGAHWSTFVLRTAVRAPWERPGGAHAVPPTVKPSMRSVG